MSFGPSRAVIFVHKDEYKIVEQFRYSNSMPAAPRFRRQRCATHAPFPGPATWAVPFGCPWPEGGTHFAGGRYK